MAYIKGNSQNNSGSNSATTIAVSLPEHQADDYIVLIVGQEGGVATFSSTGYTVVENVGSSGGSNNSSALMYKKATSSSEPNPTIQSTRSDQLSAICFIVADADLTTFIDTSDSISNTSGSISVPSITTTTDNCLLISWYSHRNVKDIQWTVSGATYNSVGGNTPLYAKTHNKDSSGVVASETLHTTTGQGKTAGIVAIRNKAGGLPPHAITGGQDYILRGGRASTISGLAALSTRVTTIDSTTVQTAISLSASPDLDARALGNTATRFGAVPSASVSTSQWTGYVFQLSSANLSDPNTFFSVDRRSLPFNFTNRFSWYAEDSLGNWAVKEYIPLGEDAAENNPYTFFGDFKSLQEVDSSGAIDYTDISYFGIAWIPAIPNSTTRYVELWHMGRDSPVIFSGGKIDTRFLAVQSSYDFKYLRSFSQGKAQDIVSQSIQIGDGTRQTTFTATGGAFEYRNADGGHFNPAVNALSLSLYGSDNCSFIFDQSLFVNPKRQRFEINPLSSLLANYSFVSTIFDNYSVTWLSGVDCVGASFINCDQMDGKGALFNQTLFINSSPDTATSALKINVGADVTACIFEKGTETYAVEIQDAGSYDFSETTFSGYTTDLNITATTGTVTIVRATGDGTPTFTTAGATVEITLPAQQISITNIVAGSRLRIYNQTTGVETVNTVVSSTSYTDSYQEGTGYNDGDIVQVYLTKLGKKEWVVSVIDTSNGFNVLASQVDDDIYTAMGIDGSTVTKFIADYPNNQADIQVAQNFSMAEFYTWWNYNLTTEQGIRQFFGGITAIDEANFRINHTVVNLFLDNTTSTNLVQTDNRRIYRTDGAYPVLPATSGGGGIDIVWRNTILIAETGVSGLTPQESLTLSAIASDSSLIPSIASKTSLILVK